MSINAKKAIKLVKLVHDRLAVQLDAFGATRSPAALPSVDQLRMIQQDLANALCFMNRPPCASVELSGKTFEEAERAMVALCRGKSGSTFELPCREISARLGLNTTVVCAVTKSLRERGVIELVENAWGSRAAKYRFNPSVLATSVPT